MHSPGAIACSMGWGLMVKLHYRHALAGSLPDLGEALVWVQAGLSPPAEQGTAPPAPGL